MITVLQANLTLPHHAAALIDLLDQYARCVEGGGKPLSTFTKINLVSTLQKRTDVTVILAFEEKKPIALLNAFEGFSTFACQPLLNIHDVFVLEAYRGRGIAKQLLKKVEQIAREKNCCKLTLEVLEANVSAKTCYQNYGFSGYQLDPKMGKAVFLEKKL